MPPSFLGLGLVRSLKPNVHYVPFWNVTSQPNDLLGVVSDVHAIDKSDPASLQAMVAESMQFAIK
jgi:protein glucosyltransferase